MTQQRNRLIQLIHVGKRELNLDDTAYRALLEGATGQSSCATMNLKQLDTVLQVLTKSGFKRRLTSDQARRYSPPSGRARTAEADKIRAIWITMARQGFVRDGGEPALNAWVARATVKLNKGVGVAKVGWLDGQLAVKVLESLKKWHRRLMVPEILRLGGLPVNRYGGPLGYHELCRVYDYYTTPAEGA